MEPIHHNRVTRQKDIYCPYYTRDPRLVSYMIQLLSPEAGETCLEPSAGEGAFIDALLATQRDLQITACELAEGAVTRLRTKYACVPKVQVKHCDFLLEGPDLFDTTGTFDKVIGNPPYGGWQDYDKRVSLKNLFPGLYVRETYGLFLVQALRRLRPGGRLVFILPETFLYLHLQRGLRQLLLENCSLLSLDIFPSSLFPGVHFGYAKLCILCLDHCRPDANHQIRIRHSTNLEELVSGTTKVIRVLQSAVKSRSDQVFPLQGDSPEAQLIDQPPLRLGEIADCVTGIYTGEDTRFLRRAPSNLRGRDRYPILDNLEEVPVFAGERPLKGLEGPCPFLPLLKGGGVPYFKSERWFIDWSAASVAHYKQDKRARFQNSTFYFRRGIGFPMVTSGRATASLIREHWIFDQSIVGVFPKEERLFGFLLAFLNSTVCWRLLRQINPSANNSAKYLRKLPIVLPPPEGLAWFDTAVEQYLEHLVAGGSPDNRLEQEIEREVECLYRVLFDDQATT